LLDGGRIRLTRTRRSTIVGMRLVPWLNDFRVASSSPPARSAVRFHDAGTLLQVDGGSRIYATSFHACLGQGEAIPSSEPAF
jgi:hypothetical protein